MKSILFFLCLGGAVSAAALTESEYLLKNKSYTDTLLSYLQFEDKANIDLASLKENKKTADAALKKASSDVSVTLQQLNQEQQRLTVLKDKKTNRPQIEASINSQKQQNLSKITTLNSQIASTHSSLQSVQLTLNSLVNEKNSIQNKVRTQEQVVRFSEDSVNSLEREIWFLELDIRQNEKKIRNLQQEMINLQAQKDASDDPIQKAQLQAQIDQRRQQIDSLNRENSRLENRLMTKEFELNDARSQLNREKNKLAILNIELDGKQNEINSQVRIKNQIENELAGLQSQKSNLVAKNNSIDNELAQLANIDSLIASSEQKVLSLNTLKAQQETVAAQAQSQAQQVTAALTQLQTEIDRQKSAVLASEKDHDLALKEFSSSLPAPKFLVTREMSLTIDSLIVTEEIAKNKDWSVFRGVSTTLGGTSVCAASTQILDASTGILSELLVAKMIDGQGTYSSPLVITTHSQILDLVVKGQLKTDKAKALLLPLLQSPVAQEKALITRYSDLSTLISSLRAHNTARVEFTVPGAPVTVPFSLRGSSSMINEMLTKCKN